MSRAVNEMMHDIERVLIFQLSLLPLPCSTDTWPTWPSICCSEGLTVNKKSTLRLQYIKENIPQ